jgi:ribosomal protein S18 acetylase RimI-like enzyme
MTLQSSPFVLPSVADVSVSRCDDLSDDDIAKLVVACFTGTDEDWRIHQGNLSVTDYPTAFHTIKQLRSKRFVHSPNQLQTALADSQPVTVVGSMVSPSHSCPQVGVLGHVGTIPRCRRRGIASLLVLSVLNALMKVGCKFSAVGTPEHNTPATRMYESLGFKDHERLIRLRRPVPTG